jgi:hypothetical protein
VLPRSNCPACSLPAAPGLSRFPLNNASGPDGVTAILPHCQSLLPGSRFPVHYRTSAAFRRSWSAPKVILSAGGAQGLARAGKWQLCQPLSAIPGPPFDLLGPRQQQAGEPGAVGRA